MIVFDPYPMHKLHTKQHKGACSVVAWTTAFETNYSSASLYLKQFGFVARGKGIPVCGLESALRAVKKSTVVEGPYSETNSVTLEKFCQLHPAGTYYVLVKGHALVVKGGVVYDHTSKPKRRVMRAWRIYKDKPRGYIEHKP